MRLLLTVIALLFPLAAFADAPRKIDMTAVLTDSGGVAIKDTTMASPDDKDCAKCAPLTLGHAAAYALFTPFQDEPNLTPDQKWARGALAMRIKDDKAAEPTAEEIVVIKRCVGKAYGALVIMRAFPLLDPNAAPPPVQ